MYVHSATVSPVPARPAIGLSSPVPTCPAALLPARSSFHAVPAWAHGEEPYGYPVPARHTLFAYTYGLANTSQTADHINRQL